MIQNCLLSFFKVGEASQVIALEETLRTRKYYKEISYIDIEDAGQNTVLLEHTGNQIKPVGTDEIF